jgi:hypothetical protein
MFSCSVRRQFTHQNAVVFVRINNVFLFRSSSEKREACPLHNKSQHETQVIPGFSALVGLDSPHSSYAHFRPRRRFCNVPEQAGQDMRTKFNP